VRARKLKAELLKESRETPVCRRLWRVVLPWANRVNARRSLAATLLNKGMVAPVGFLGSTLIGGKFNVDS
jgi:hypothetical protein